MTEVAVFIGATSGIGEYTLHAFVAEHERRASAVTIYFVGRNTVEAERIIRECHKMYAAATIQFVKATDLASIQDVDVVCRTILDMENGKRSTEYTPHIDRLIMTHGGLYLGARRDTKERLDMSMALHYYSRARFVLQLMPLMLNTNEAHILAVHAAGMEGNLDLSDLALQKPGAFSFTNGRSHAVYMTTMLFEHVARTYPGRVSAMNCFPGLVITPGFTNPVNQPLWFRMMCKVLVPVMRLAATAPEECGRRMLHLTTSAYPAKSSVSDAIVGTDDIAGSGAYACGIDGQALSPENMRKAYARFDRGELRNKVMQHTNEVFSQIERTGYFEQIV